MIFGRVFSLFKVPTHREFNFKPLYYNEEKEELENRIKAIRSEMKQQEQDAPEEMDNRAFIQFRKERFSSDIQRQKRQSQVRLAVIISFLVAITWYLLKYV